MIGCGICHPWSACYPILGIIGILLYFKSELTKNSKNPHVSCNFSKQQAFHYLQVWSVIPIIILAVCSYVVVVSLMITELRLLVVCAVCVTLIVGVYYVFVYKGCRSKRFGKWLRYEKSMLVLYRWICMETKNLSRISF